MIVQVGSQNKVGHVLTYNRQGHPFTQGTNATRMDRKETSARSDRNIVSDKRSLFEAASVIADRDGCKYVV